ncbi:DUF3592 domain-containing protein [Pseudomarimonas salicorniae]|uniref:DUF3592 domain-containing protein n=1 Tax=Pseudomarimonas salicorniae TaxID=2933270 RepID=A0ABT0GG36_9GAMM|nr:DUF3592 domain-containing protein [Lysobacter sp. CAU 1642]MCK7593491.1 DUF3592 domain-containing protein [Lysobacter sp. CAU 1642]
MSALDKQRRAGRISNIVLGGITLLLLGVSAFLFWTDYSVFVVGERSEGVVIAKREVSTPSRTGTGHTTSYQVRYRFQPEGQSMRYGRQSVARSRYEQLEPGDRVPVWFDTGGGEVSYIDRRARWNGPICLLIALCFAAGTAYSIRYQRRLEGH